MPEQAGQIEYVVSLNTTQFDNGIKENESKFNRLKSKIESATIGVKLDVNCDDLQKQLKHCIEDSKHSLIPKVDSSRLESEMNSVLNKININPIKLKIDTSEVTRQINEIEQSVARIQGMNINIHSSGAGLTNLVGLGVNHAQANSNHRQLLAQLSQSRSNSTLNTIGRAVGTVGNAVGSAVATVGSGTASVLAGTGTGIIAGGIATDAVEGAAEGLVKATTGWGVTRVAANIAGGAMYAAKKLPSYALNMARGIPTAPFIGATGLAAAGAIGSFMGGHPFLSDMAMGIGGSVATGMAFRAASSDSLYFARHNIGESISGAHDAVLGGFRAVGNIAKIPFKAGAGIIDSFRNIQNPAVALQNMGKALHSAFTQDIFRPVFPKDIKWKDLRTKQEDIAFSPSVGKVSNIPTTAPTTAPTLSVSSPATSGVIQVFVTNWRDFDFGRGNSGSGGSGGGTGDGGTGSLFPDEIKKTGTHAYDIRDASTSSSIKYKKQSNKIMDFSFGTDDTGIIPIHKQQTINDTGLFDKLRTFNAHIKSIHTPDELHNIMSADVANQQASIARGEDYAEIPKGFSKEQLEAKRKAKEFLAQQSQYDEYDDMPMRAPMGQRRRRNGNRPGFAINPLFDIADGLTAGFEKLKSATGYVSDSFSRLGKNIFGMFGGAKPLAGGGSGGSGGGNSGGGGSSADSFEDHFGPIPDAKGGKNPQNPLLKRLMRHYGITSKMTMAGVGITAGILALGEANNIDGSQYHSQLANINGANGGMSSYLHRQAENPYSVGDIYRKDVEGLPLVGNLIASASENITGNSYRSDVMRKEKLASDYDFAIGNRRQDVESIQGRLNSIASQNALYADPAHQISALNNKNAAENVGFGLSLAEKKENLQARYLSNTVADRAILDALPTDKPYQTTPAIQQAQANIKKYAKERNDRSKELDEAESKRKSDSGSLLNQQVDIIKNQRPFIMDAIKKSLTDTLGASISASDAQHFTDPEKGKIAKDNIITQYKRETGDIEGQNQVAGLRNQGFTKQADILAINNQREIALRSVQGTDKESVARRAAINDEAVIKTTTVNDDFAESLRKMTASVKISEAGLAEFGGGLKRARAEIEEEFVAASYKKDPEVVEVAKKVKNAKLEELRDNQITTEQQQALNTLTIKDANHVRLEQLKGNGIGAANLEADLKGKQRLAEIEIKHKAHGFNSEDEYIQEKEAIKETNRLDKIEASRRSANATAQSVGSFQGAFFIGKSVEDDDKKPQMFGPPAPKGVLPPQKAIPPVKGMFGPPSPTASAGSGQVDIQGAALQYLAEIARNSANKAMVTASA